MSRILLITVHLHEGRYHGVGDEAPSPARLFQALLAGIGLGGPLAAQESEALEWLEKCGPPVVGAPAMTDGQTIKNYVPNNDLDVVGGDARRIGAIRTPKIIRPRLFDTDIPFMYAWTYGDDDESMAQAICVLAERLYQLGRGVDLAWAWAEALNKEEFETRLSSYAGLVYRPSDGGSGTMLACPQPGSVRSLKARHAASSQRFKAQRRGKATKQLFSQPPKPLFRQVAYDSPPSRRVYELRLSDSESSVAVWPLVRASNLVVLLRDAAVKRLRQALPERHSTIEQVLVGRKADGTDDGPISWRVRIVPLPTIGHHHADRGIRRVLVEVPPGCPLRADDMHWAFSGLEAVAPELGAAQPLVITPSADEGMFPHYGIMDRTSCVWRTVTPVALPEAARRRRIDPTRVAAEAKNGPERAAEQTRAAGAIVQALRFAEIRSKADSIRVQREPFESKGDRAEVFAPGSRFAKERLWHVEITFREQIKGPVVIGDGRFLGLGVMAPVQAPQQQETRHNTVARFILDGPVLPLVTDAVRVAEAFRAAAMSRFQAWCRRQPPAQVEGFRRPDRPERYSSSVLCGKDASGRCLAGHGHAYFAPTAEGDDPYRLTHVTVHARQGFGAGEKAALTGLQRLHVGELDVRAQLIGLGRPSDFRADLFGGPAGAAAVWESATPYVGPAHVGRSGRERYMRKALRRELRRCLSAWAPGVDVRAVEAVTEADSAAGGPRPFEFRRSRSRPGNDGYRRPHGLFRVTLSAPVEGPLCLGYASHYGLGLFLPAVAKDNPP